MTNIPQSQVKRGVAKPLRKVYQKPLRRFTSHTRMPAGIRGFLKIVALLSFAQLSYQLIAYPRIAKQYVCASSRGATLDRIKRGVALC